MSNITAENKNRVFVVRGRDEAAKLAVARSVEKLGLTAVILHEQPNEGRTIIEKFETHANVAYAIVILTPDDIVVTSEGQNRRARQNVIFELGYFIGRLGRNRVSALYKSGIELPSDYHGILYISLDTQPSAILKMNELSSSWRIY